MNAMHDLPNGVHNMNHVGFPNSNLVQVMDVEVVALQVPLSLLCITGEAEHI